MNNITFKLAVALFACVTISACGTAQSPIPSGMLPAKAIDLPETAFYDTLRAKGGAFATVDEDATTELATLISGALKRLINDTLWYFPEAADYKGVIGTNIEYEYFYDATASKVYILTIAPMADCYRLFVFDKNISGLPDTVSRSYNSDDRQWLLGKIPVPLSGTGTIRVDDSHIPDYNVTGQELNVEQILSAFYETMYSGNSYYDIYIQYHYKSSDVTYIMYSFDGTTWCSRIALSDMSVAKPFQLIPGSDADSYFIEKLQESSYKAL